MADEQSVDPREALLQADRALVEALEARARAVRRLAEVAGAADLPGIRQVIEALGGVGGELSPRAVEAVLREAVSVTNALVQPRTVAVAGLEGGFAHLAAWRHFGAGARCRAMDTIGAVLEEVERERADFGVVPLESSAEGANTATLYGLLRGRGRIVAEQVVEARYHLFSVTGNLADVEKVYGDPEALADCRRHLRTYLPRAAVIDVPSTEIALQFAVEDHGAAAIATDLGRQEQGLRLLKERVEDDPGRFVRFAIVGRQLAARTGRDRTVLAMGFPNQPGVLYEALQPFARRHVNLTRLESRTARDEAWAYTIFVEMEGHVTDRSLAVAIEEVRQRTSFLEVLGSYPRPE